MTEHTIIVAAPAGPGRQRLTELLRRKGATVRSLERERLVPQGQLVIEDTRVLLGGEDLLLGATAAVILEPGTMWPLPALDPTAEQWAAHRGRFDDWLRDERESASLWFSLLAIIDELVPTVVNPQVAQAHLALKPDALALLREAGVAVAPTLVTNDPEAVARFCADHPDDALLALPLWPGAAPRRLAREDLAALPLDQEPLLLQALPGAEQLDVTAVAGRALDGTLPPRAEASVRAVHEHLELTLGLVTFRGAAENLLLSDLGLPDLGAIDEHRARQVVDALWDHLEAACP